MTAVRRYPPALILPAGSGVTAAERRGCGQASLGPRAARPPFSDRRFTLRGRIGCRPVKRPRRMPRALALAIGIYVCGGVVGWAAMATLIAVAFQ